MCTTKNYSNSCFLTTDKCTMYFYVTKHAFLFFSYRMSLIIYERAQKPHGLNRIIFNIYIFIRIFLFHSVYIELDTTHMYLYIESFLPKKYFYTKTTKKNYFIKKQCYKMTDVSPLNNYYITIFKYRSSSITLFSCFTYLKEISNKQK